LICLKHNALNYRGDWIAIRTFKATHQKSKIHLDAISFKATEIADEERRLQTTSDYFAEPNYINVDKPLQSIAENSSAQEKMEDMWLNFDRTFEISESPADVHARAREKFNRQAQEYGLWGSLETVPDLEMEQIEQLWDEEKQEDLLSNLLESIGITLILLLVTTFNLIY